MKNMCDRREKTEEKPQKIKIDLDIYIYSGI
jgi:hypothetical protein